MSTVKMIATRESYLNALLTLGEEHDDFMFMYADLAESTKTIIFQKKFPNRHVDCGIAEGNMMAMAAGIAATGHKVFASSFAMFAAGRAYEQIRNSIAYPHLPVVIGATHGGISVGEDGASHQCIEDFSLMRVIPGMTVISPADDVEARAAVKAAYFHDGPVYIRFGRLAVPVIFDEKDYQFEIGKGQLLKEGNDLTIISTGMETAAAMEAVKLLLKDKVEAELINIHTIKPIDKELIIKSAKKTKKVITVEEHSIIGGLGSAVCEALAEETNVKIHRIGVDDRFGESGEAKLLLEKFGLDAKGVYENIKKWLSI